MTEMRGGSVEFEGSDVETGRSFRLPHVLHMSTPDGHSGIGHGEHLGSECAAVTCCRILRTFC